MFVDNVLRTLVSLLNYVLAVVYNFSAQRQRGIEVTSQGFECTTGYSYGTSAIKYRPSHFNVIEGGKKASVASPERPTPVVFGIQLKTVIVTAACVLAVAMISYFAQAYASQSRDAALSSTKLETIHVLEGESLWSIAESYPVSGCSTKDVANYIIEKNNLSDSMLQVGQSLNVPTN